MAAPACRKCSTRPRYLKSKDLGKVCALVTDGRFSGGTSGLSIGHASPEAAEGGTIGLVEEGDMIDIDIPNRTLNVRVSEAELARRRAAMDAKGALAWKPVNRIRAVSPALRAYAVDGDLGGLRRGARCVAGGTRDRSADSRRPAGALRHCRPAQFPRRCRWPDLRRHRQPRRPRDDLSAGRACGELPSEIAA